METIDKMINIFNYTCLFILYRIIPIYIILCISIPLFLNNNEFIYDNVQKINNINFTDSNYNLMRLLYASNSLLYCIINLLFIDIKSESDIFLFYRICGLISETLFFICAEEYITEKYENKILFVLIIRILDLFTFLLK